MQTIAPDNQYGATPRMIQRHFFEYHRMKKEEENENENEEKNVLLTQQFA